MKADLRAGSYHQAAQQDERQVSQGTLFGAVAVKDSFCENLLHD
jgi:hypothetical protein